MFFMNNNYGTYAAVMVRRWLVLAGRGETQIALGRSDASKRFTVPGASVGCFLFLLFILGRYSHGGTAL
jgi:hypothetical protein